MERLATLCLSIREHEEECDHLFREMMAEYPSNPTLISLYSQVSFLLNSERERERGKKKNERERERKEREEENEKQEREIERSDRKNKEERKKFEGIRTRGQGIQMTDREQERERDWKIAGKFQKKLARARTKRKQRVRE